ncbi:adenylate/guanylate cyclase domain-containing protein [soil metagenome]
MKGFKECPACAEWVRAKALVCRFCGAVLSNEALPKFVAGGGRVDESLLEASVNDRFGGFELDISPAQRRRIVEFLKSSEENYRTATVMFVDINGFTALCEQIKPEYVQEILKAYYAIVLTTVGAFNGFVVEFVGDGALAVFGAPMAFERDAEAAVRAAIEIRARVRALPLFQKKRVRVSAGLATGEILSTVVKSKTIPHYKVIGPAVNLASRVQNSAVTDTLVIDDETQKLVAGVFESEELPAREFKNVSRKVTTFVIKKVKEGGVQRRVLTGPFVGREAELKSMRTALASSAGAVAITGETGIGKSRLIAEYLKHEPNFGARVMVESSPFEARIPYGAWRMAIESLLRDEAGEGADSLEKRLARFVKRHGFGPDHQASLRLILGIQSRKEATLKNLPPWTIRRLLASDLSRTLQAVAAQRPAVIVFDDLQWADPSSVDLLQAVLFEARPRNVSFIFSHRSDFALTGELWKTVDAIALSELSQDERVQLFNLLADTREMLPQWRDKLIDTAEGNPLFLTEMMLGLSAARLSGVEGGTWAPASLRQMIQSRIDQLQENKRQVLQAGAVLGRQFALSLIRLLDESGTDLIGRLYALKTAQFLHDDPQIEEILFFFRQHLTREVAYYSLFETRRREMHRALADRLEAKDGDKKDRDLLTLLGFHYQLAGQDEKAAHYLELSGVECFRVGATTEARNAFEQALRLVKLQEKSRDTRMREMRLLRSLGTLDRYAGDQDAALKQTQEALAIGQALKLKEEVLDLRHLEALVEVNRGQTDKAAKSLAKLLAEVRRTKLHPLECKILNVLGICAWRAGDIKEALAHYEACLKLARPADNPDLIADLHSNIGLIKWKAGEFAEASKSFTKGIAMRKKSGNRFGLAIVQKNLGIVTEALGKPAAARALYEEARSVARAIHFPEIEGAVLTNISNLEINAGNFGEGLRLSTEAEAIAKSINDRRGESIALENAGLCQIGLKRFDEAAKTLKGAEAIGKQLGDDERKISTALALVELSIASGREMPKEADFQNLGKMITKSGILAEAPRLHRLWAESRLRAGDEKGASQKLKQAMAHAEEQGNAVEVEKAGGFRQRAKVARK